MRTERCTAGHFYDADRFSVCPYCSGAEDEGRTISYAHAADEEKTVAFSASPSPENREESAGSPVVGWLVCVRGAERGRDYRLQAGRNFIGRSLDMDVCIREDASISRDNHASLVYDPRSGRFVLLPGDSSATRYNGAEIYTRQDLKDGDIIGIGETELCFISFCREGRTW